MEYYWNSIISGGKWAEQEAKIKSLEEANTKLTNELTTSYHSENEQEINSEQSSRSPTPKEVSENDEKKEQNELAIQTEIK